MQGYETILVPIDIYSDYELVVEKAIAIAGRGSKRAGIKAIKRRCRKT